MNYQLLAEQMVKAYYTNSDIKKRVDESPEPYRAMIWETGIISNPQEIDGPGCMSEDYSFLIDELENIWGGY